MRSGAQRNPTVLVVLALALGIAAILFFLSRREPRHVLPDAREMLHAPEGTPERSDVELRDVPAPRIEVPAVPNAKASAEPPAADPVAVAAPADPVALEVAVYVGEQTAVGARVEMWEGGPESFPRGEPFDDSAPSLGPEPLRRETTDRAGLVRLDGIRAGRYGLRVTLPDGARVLRFVEIAEGEVPARVIVVFGSSSVSGTLYGVDGAPRGNESLWLRQTVPPSNGVDRERWTRTDPDGSFRFERLTPGPTLLIHIRPSGEEPGHRARFELGESQHRSIDLGTPGGPVTWRGQLRLPSGAPLPESLEVELEEMEHGWLARLMSDAGGAFSVTLQPGLYLATLAGFGGPTDLDTVMVLEEGIYADLVLPAVYLRVELPDLPQAMDSPPAYALVLLVAEGAPDGSGSLMRGSLSPDASGRGHVFACGVPPGRYQASCKNLEASLVVPPDAERVDLALDWTEAPSQAR